MDCKYCNNRLEPLDFIKSDGTTNRPYDMVIAQCPECKSIIHTKYDPSDWWTEKQIRIIEKMMK